MAMEHPERFIRLLWTIRYLSLGQVASRSSRLLRQWWNGWRRRNVPLVVAPRFASPRPLYAGLTDGLGQGRLAMGVTAAVERARKSGQGRFSFLNREVRFAGAPGWNDPNLSQLWRYHLHYFGCVQDLLIASAAGENEQAFATFRRLARSWIEDNRRLVGDGWHPYTISLRLVNWLNAASGWAGQLAADTAFRTEFFDSLYSQAKLLAGNLEFDVRGNHLLENLRALIWAGVAFAGDEARGWLDRSLGILEREVGEQVLADGCHFERTPGYHWVVLKDLLEIALWLRRNRPGELDWLDDAIRRMMKHGTTMLPRGGNVPLLKDTAWDAAPAPDEVLEAGAIYFNNLRFKYTAFCGLYSHLLFGSAAAGEFDGWPINREVCVSTPPGSGGYAVLRDDASGDHLVFDVGRPCPDYLPAHAHADMLGFELVVGGERVVVDSGVYEYSAGLWRDFFRSTRAHNTVEVDGENQSEVWSSFRVARRARPHDIRWRAADEVVTVQASHDGYLRLRARVWHRRTLHWQKGEFWLIWDELEGRGKFQGLSHLHLRTELELQASSAAVWRIVGSSQRLWISATGHDSSSLIQGQMAPEVQGWYSECFGQRQPNPVLTLRVSGTGRVGFGYLIARGDPAVLSAERDNEGDWRLAVRQANRVRNLVIRRAPMVEVP